MAQRTLDPRIQLLLEIVDTPFGRKSWHGTTLRGALRGLTVDVALWRPAPSRHNVWELLLHAAYWKYIVRRRLTGDKALRFSRKPSNWPRPPDPPSARQLKADIALLQREHELLCDAIRLFEASRLQRRPPDSSWTYAQYIHGAAAHDLYHTGQIQLIKRLQKG